MSIINNILEKITGLDLDGSDSKNNSVTERPCSNCPSDCAIAGVACDVCQPYKKKLIDWVYHVDHLEEFLSRYEVVSTMAPTASGTTHCPFCGANSADPYICEYCGSGLAEKPAFSGKIQVNAASEIPNPIMEAQNVIWERYDAVIKKYNIAVKSSIKGSLIGDLMSQLIGSGSNEDEEESALGAKMSEAEIREAASLYKVTVGEYLTGLDNGKYLTLSGKKEADAQGRSASSYAPASMGLPGMAAIGGFAYSIFANGAGRRRPQYHNPVRSPHPSELQRPTRPSQTEPIRRPARPSQTDPIERPSRPSQTSQSDPLQRPSRPSQTPSRPSGNTERRRPDSHVISPNVSKETPKRPSSGNGPSMNRRDNLINRETGERMRKPSDNGSHRGGNDSGRGGRGRG